MRKCSYGVPLSADGMRMGINGRIYQITDWKEEIDDDFDFGEEDHTISGLLNGKPWQLTHNTVLLGEREEEGGWYTWRQVEDTKAVFDVHPEDTAAVWDWLSDLGYDVVNQQETEYQVEEM